MSIGLSKWTVEQQNRYPDLYSELDDDDNTYMNCVLDVVDYIIRSMRDNLALAAPNVSWPGSVTSEDLGVFEKIINSKKYINY